MPHCNLIYVNLLTTEFPPFGNGRTTLLPYCTTLSTTKEFIHPTVLPSVLVSCPVFKSSSVTTRMTQNSCVKSPQTLTSSLSLTSSSLTQQTQPPLCQGWLSVTTVKPPDSFLAVTSAVVGETLQTPHPVHMTDGTWTACGSSVETTAAVCPTPWCATIARTVLTAVTRTSVLSHSAVAQSLSAMKGIR